jgi:hypothetical protein
MNDTLPIHTRTLPLYLARRIGRSSHRTTYRVGTIVKEIDRQRGLAIIANATLPPGDSSYQKAARHEYALARLSDVAPWSPCTSGRPLIAPSTTHQPTAHLAVSGRFSVQVPIRVTVPMSSNAAAPLAPTRSLLLVQFLIRCLYERVNITEKRLIIRAGICFW